MQTTERGDGYEIHFHVGKTADRLQLTLVVTNTGDEPISTHSGGGAWARIELVDEHEVRRLESMGTTMAVTHWTIPPGESLVSTRGTEQPDEVIESEVPEIQYVTDVDEADHEARVYYAPNVSFPKDETTKMTATGRVDLQGLSTNISCTFTPTDLPAPIDVESEFDMAEDPRGMKNQDMSLTPTDDRKFTGVRYVDEDDSSQ